MKQVYFRCNSGHYFSGGSCPLDGWSSKDWLQLRSAVLAAEATEGPGVKELRESGVSEDTLARLVVIEFGSASSAFDAIAPSGYVVDGRWLPMDGADSRFL